MAKELILTKDVDGLGIVGDVVKVADGYARNFLYPKGYAAPVSEIMKQRLAEARAKRELELVKEKETAERLAEKLSNASITIAALVNEEGRLYGAISTQDIIDAAEKQKIALDKKMIHIDHPIRETGRFEVTVVLHPEVKTTLEVWVNEDA